MRRSIIGGATLGVVTEHRSRMSHGRQQERGGARYCSNTHITSAQSTLAAPRTWWQHQHNLRQAWAVGGRAVRHEDGGRG